MSRLTNARPTVGEMPRDSLTAQMTWCEFARIVDVAAVLGRVLGLVVALLTLPLRL